MKENVKNEQAFFSLMNLKCLPFIIFSFFPSKIDFCKDLDAYLFPSKVGLHCSKHEYPSRARLTDTLIHTCKYI